jgi:hypothetical protein
LGSLGAPPSPVQGPVVPAQHHVIGHSLLSVGPSSVTENRRVCLLDEAAERSLT